MAHATTEVNVSDPGTLKVSTKLKTFYAILMFVGLLAFILTVINDPKRAWSAYLIGFFYTVTLALGGLFLTALQHVTHAGWSVNVRRLFESFTGFLPLAFVTGIIFMLLGAKELYIWLDPAIVAGDKLLQHKSAYLNSTFFWIRFVGFFFLWMLFAKVIVGRSLKQDETGDVSLTHRLVAPSVLFVLFFALSYSFFSLDTLMTLEPHWFSTIYGVYAFAGMFQSVMAVTIILIAYLWKKGLLKDMINENHLHDLGKFLFGFTVFWAYIAFSQYMLIWYANIPEETVFFEPRTHGSWGVISVSLILFKFIVPFFALLPQWAKRNVNHLVVISIWILVMQFVDLYWLVYPGYNHEQVILGLPEVGIFLGFIGLFIFAVTQFLSKHSLIPFKDPRIHESVNHHVVY